MNPSPTELGIWLSVFAVIVGLGANVALVIGTFRTQRRHVRLEDNFATVPELYRVEQRVEGVASDLRLLKDHIVTNGEVRRKSIESKVEAVRTEVKNDVGKLGEQVVEIGNQVCALGATCEMMNQTVAQLDAKMMGLIERRADP